LDKKLWKIRIELQQDGNTGKDDTGGYNNIVYVGSRVKVAVRTQVDHRQESQSQNLKMAMMNGILPVNEEKGGEEGGMPTNKR
jgi:hypothetical protein